MKIYSNELKNIVMDSLPWEKLRNNTIMLSGATGMIGKCIIDVLMLRNRMFQENIKIIALSRNEQCAKERLKEYWKEPLLTFISCDVNQVIPECGKVDYVIHAASNTHPIQYAKDSIGTIMSNVIGTKNMLDYAVEHYAKRFCFLSSVEIYGENRGDIEKFDENYLGYINCNTLRAGYPESKRVGEAFCNAYRQTYGLDYVIPRLCRVYGPTMLLSDSKAISQFIKNAVVGENIVLKSEGNQKYSYTFITDAVCGIFYTLLYGEAAESYNIADHKSDITLKALAEYLAEVSGTELVFQMPDGAEQKGYSMATKAMLNAEKLEKLGWNARVHMKEGLKCTVNAIKNDITIIL